MLGSAVRILQALPSKLIVITVLLGRHCYSHPTEEGFKVQDYTARTDSRTLALTMVLLSHPHWADGEAEAQRTAGTFPN